MRFKTIEDAEKAFAKATTHDEVAAVLRQVQKQRRSLLGPLNTRPFSPSSNRMRVVTALNSAIDRLLLSQ